MTPLSPWNHYRHLETYFGVPGIQAVLHTINLRLSPAQQKFTIDKAEDRFLIVDVDRLDLVAELLELGLPSVEAVIVLADAVPEHRLAIPVHSYEELLAGGDENARFAEFDEKTASAMCFTSATTRDPKGVVHSHRALVLQAMCLAMHHKLNMAERQIWLEVAPMFHFFALKSTLADRTEDEIYTTGTNAPRTRSSTGGCAPATSAASIPRVTSC